MDQAEFEAVVAQAMLAPSAHNTQPARWALRNGGIEVLADLSRRLPIGDPTDRDLEVSCGAAVEGTVLALAARGVGAKVTLSDGMRDDGLRNIARVMPEGAATAKDAALAAEMPKRLTHRSGFLPAPNTAFDNWAGAHMKLVTDAAQIDWLAKQIDVASAQIMRPKPFRFELLHWMRLRKDDPKYDTDGLNRDVLAMDATTAMLVPVVLGTKVYGLLSALGLGPQLSGEAACSKDASAIALFHWPAEGVMVEAGRAFYRTWLQATARGLVGWPAAALADDPATRAEVSDRFNLPGDRVLFNALRLGVANKAPPSRARLSTHDVIV
jgi:nitroreductase